MLKILNWIFKKYLREYLSRRVVKLSNAMFIPDIEIVQSNGAVLPWYRDKIFHKLTMEIVKRGLIRIERQKNDELGGETITAKIYIFKFPKDKSLG